MWDALIGPAFSGQLPGWFPLSWLLTVQVLGVDFEWSLVAKS